MFRQSEWEDYKGHHSTVLQGDLADPLYFDFISFCQYVVIADKIRKGRDQFVEKVAMQTNNFQSFSYISLDILLWIPRLELMVKLSLFDETPKLNQIINYQACTRNWLAENSLSERFINFHSAYFSADFCALIVITTVFFWRNTHLQCCQLSESTRAVNWGNSYFKQRPCWIYSRLIPMHSMSIWTGSTVSNYHQLSPGSASQPQPICGPNKFCGFVGIHLLMTLRSR